MSVFFPQKGTETEWPSARKQRHHWAISPLRLSDYSLKRGSLTQKGRGCVGQHRQPWRNPALGRKLCQGSKLIDTCRKRRSLREVGIQFAIEHSRDRRSSAL